MKKSLILLWLVSVAATAAGMPYSFELQGETIAKAPFPLPALVLIALVQTAILLAIAVFVGAKSARSIGLRIFALREISSESNKAAKVKAILKLGIPAGIITAVAIYAADLFMVRFTPQLSIQTIHPTVWKTLLASFYGGVVEEVLMRLFLVSLFAWILVKLFKPEKPIENKGIMWSAIVISAIIFGLGHLPVTAAITAITPLIVVRAILLNGIGGFVFGWLYWKKGLEYAILAHFTTDIVLLVVLPSLLK